MAIDSVVIRYLPYDPGQGIYAVGVTLNPVNFSGKATAYYPGHAAQTDNSSFIGYPDAGGGGFISGLNIVAAGLAGPVYEWPFVTLAPDGITATPINTGTASILAGYTQCYAGGVIEIAAYIDGALVMLGSASFASFSDGGSDSASLDISLAWPAPSFWTKLNKASESA